MRQRGEKKKSWYLWSVITQGDVGVKKMTGVWSFWSTRLDTRAHEYQLMFCIDSTLFANSGHPYL